MPSPTALPQPETEADLRAGDSEYYRGVLHGLIDMGADLARMVHQQARAAAESAPPGAETAADATVAFDRVARAVRRTIALARTLDEPAPPVAGRVAAGHADQQRTAVRKQIIRAVENSIHQEWWGEEAEALHAELLERLDGPDIDGDIGHRTVEEIIATIRCDLGLAGPDGLRLWKRRTPGDVALLCARAAKRPAAPGPDVGVRAMPPASEADGDPARHAFEGGTGLHGHAGLPGSGLQDSGFRDFGFRGAGFRGSG